METKNFMNKVHEVMISLVKYMICGECNITMDTENFMNMVHEVINSLVKYMIWGEATSSLTL